jgi:hypothetical protein
MVSDNYRKYRKILRYPDLKMVRLKGVRQKWHFNEPLFACKMSAQISEVNGEQRTLKVWITQSLEKDKLYMLDRNGNEISPDVICDSCAGRMMKLLKWRSSEEGNLEIEQQELRNETEERDFRAKGLIE